MYAMCIFNSLYRTIRKRGSYADEELDEDWVAVQEMFKLLLAISVATKTRWYLKVSSQQMCS